MMQYFVIFQHDKYATCLEYETKEALLKDYLDYGWQAINWEDSESDPGTWGENAVLIIKGYIVEPTEKRVVTELDIE